MKRWVSGEFIDPSERILHNLMSEVCEFVEWNRRNPVIDWNMNEEHLAAWHALINAEKFWKQIYLPDWHKFKNYGKDVNLEIQMNELMIEVIKYRHIYFY